MTGIAQLLESARHLSARAVNAVMTATYWEIGRRIVEFEQGGKSRAEYGDALLKRLSEDLARNFGRGFSERNIEQMRGFYRAWPISQTLSAKCSAVAHALRSTLEVQRSKFSLLIRVHLRRSFGCLRLLPSLPWALSGQSLSD